MLPAAMPPFPAAAPSPPADLAAAMRPAATAAVAAAAAATATPAMAAGDKEAFGHVFVWLVHCPVVVLHVVVVQLSKSTQTTGVFWQTPSKQTSVVHKSLSSQSTGTQGSVVGVGVG